MAKGEWRPLCTIVCLHCHNIFVSPMQFEDANSFFNSALIGSTLKCPFCTKSTGCNKENMRFGTVTEESGWLEK
jgi:hypothetical protein